MCCDRGSWRRAIRGLIITYNVVFPFYVNYQAFVVLYVALMSVLMFVTALKGHVTAA